MQQQQIKQHTGSTGVQLKMDRTLALPLNAYQNQGVWLRLLIERGIHGLAITLLLLPTAIRQKNIYIYICTYLISPPDATPCIFHQCVAAFLGSHCP